MNKKLLFWILAFIITLAGAYYQRVTGPTYPVTGSVYFNQNKIKYDLERSHSSTSNYIIAVETNDSSVSGELRWKRYKTNDEWTYKKMNYSNGKLQASIPKQPPAGKIQYQIKLRTESKETVIPADHSVIIRFKGDVPHIVLIPHIIIMFLVMLVSTRTGLEYFNENPNFKKLTLWTLGLLIIGGMILGPLTQFYAFGELWTGIPFGIDLTDNKTLIALIGWIAAAIAVYKSKNPKKWILAAAILLLLVYSIPHSVLGSELDYSKLNH